MEVSIKHFSELSRDELFDIYKLRVSVFVVEQQCPYQEVDDGDRSAYHVFMKDEEGDTGLSPDPAGGRVL